MFATPARRFFPVIHALDLAQVMTNARIAADAGVDGVFLISMEAQDEFLREAVVEARQRCPELVVGVNYLQSAPADALLTNLLDAVPMTWADRCGVSSSVVSDEARYIGTSLAGSIGHEFFGSVAFKYQSDEPDPGAAAQRAAELGMIPTTSGPATGRVANIQKLQAMRHRLGPSTRLALASGVTPDNIGDYLETVTDYLVATGISADFYHFDAAKLGLVARAIAGYNASAPLAAQYARRQRRDRRDPSLRDARPRSASRTSDPFAP